MDQVQTWELEWRNDTTLDVVQRYQGSNPLSPQPTATADFHVSDWSLPFIQVRVRLDMLHLGFPDPDTLYLTRLWILPHFQHSILL
jgi:ribosomal protein S18 acetylase RimI-like enzyme